jgi:hypothetical protein
MVITLGNCHPEPPDPACSGEGVPKDPDNAEFLLAGGINPRCEDRNCIKLTVSEGWTGQCDLVKTDPDCVMAGTEETPIS